MTDKRVQIEGYATAEQLSEIMGVNVKTIYEWSRMYGMPKLRRGRYPLIECIRWQINRLTQRTADETGLEDERRLLVISQRQRQDLDNAARRGELLDAEMVSGVFAEVASSIASQLDSLGPRMAGKLATMDDPAVIQQVLISECRNVRSSIARSAVAIASDQADGGNNGTAAGKKRRRVGRRKQNPAAGKSGAGAVAN